MTYQWVSCIYNANPGWIAVLLHVEDNYLTLNERSFSLLHAECWKLSKPHSLVNNEPAKAEQPLVLTNKVTWPFCSLPQGQLHTDWIAQGNTSSTKLRGRSPQFYYQGQDISTLRQAGNSGPCWTQFLQSQTQMQKPSPKAGLQSQSNDTRFPEVPLLATHFSTQSWTRGQG